jgi:hypothetical protein
LLLQLLCEKLYQEKIVRPGITRLEKIIATEASCLNLVVNAIILWNTVYMQAVIGQLRTEGYPIKDDDLRHLGPARYEHINPYGHYTFNVQQELQRKGLRPLRTP